MNELKFDVDKMVALLRKTQLFDADFYLSRNIDVRDSKTDPIFHYVVAGEREGRRPNMLFDPNWYQKTYRVDPNAVNLFIHYLAVGEKAGFNPSPLFNATFVRKSHQLNPSASAFQYFVSQIGKQVVDPNPYFKTNEYLEVNPDVLSSPMPPYYHFIEYGVNEGRIPSKQFSWAYVRSAYGLQGNNRNVYGLFCQYADAFGWCINGDLPAEKIQSEIRRNHLPALVHEAKALQIDRSALAKVDVFAFYLPQFHKVEENDDWWGEGFTEWANLSRGVPRYEGHYQPRVPGGLGFYDLSGKQALSAQVKLARNAGLTGFGIYYYNFGPKKLLRKPLELLRDSPELDINYFLIWANESWSRRWDGSEADVLAAQEYAKGFEKNLAKDFCSYFADARYHSIDGHPLLVIYRASHIPDSKKFIKKLRTECKKHGYEPLIFIAQSFGDSDPRVHGADGAIEFPPHKLSSELSLINDKKNLYTGNPELKVYSYDEVVQASLASPDSEFRLIKTAFPSWDNDARKQGASSVFDGATPDKFEAWLKALIEMERKKCPEHGIVCINAWNEWGEGAYLEPDRHLGYANLNAVLRALTSRPSYKKKSVVLVGHDLFDGGAQRLLLEIGKQLKQSGAAVLFLIVSEAACSENLLLRYKLAGEVRFLSETAQNNSWDALHAELSARETTSFIFNTSLSAQWAHALPQLKGSKFVLLVHEMTGMLKLSCDANRLKDNIDLFSTVVFPAKVVQAQFERFIGKSVPVAAIQPQGMYKRVSDLEPHVGNEERFRQFVGKKRHPLVVVGVGYADLRKGFDLFVNTCVELTRRNVDVLFVWQGGVHPDFDRWLFADMEHLIRQKRLLLVPSNENIGNIMSVADAYFLSSREDPFPSVAMEAWHFGVPVFAFRRSGGIADLIEKDGRLGVTLAELSIVDATNKLESLKADAQRPAEQQSLRSYRRTYVHAKHEFASFTRRLAEYCSLSAQVDVCVLTYNHERFIRDRLQSIMEQTAFRRTVRVFDASSNDSTRDQVAAFNLEKEFSISVLTTPQNGGYLPDLWRTAVNATTAEFVWLAEGDDSSHPHFLDRCLDVLQKDRTIGLVFTGVQRIDDKGEGLDTSIQSYVESIMGYAWSSGGVFDGQQFLEAGATVANPITNISAVVWRREALIQALDVFSKFNKLHFAFDWMLYVALAKHGWKVAYTIDMLSRHRIYGESFSGRLEMDQHLKEIRNLYGLIDKLVKSQNKERRIEYLDRLTTQ